MFLKLIISLCFNNEFLFVANGEYEEHESFLSLSPDEPDEPDGWRNVLFLPTDFTNITKFIFLCSFVSSVVCLSLSGSSGSSGDYI